MKVGDYALIVKVPDAWEGAGEDPEDREALLGHVGLVVEVPDPNQEYFGLDDCVLLRFPWLNSEGVTGQRNVEITALEVVSSPALPIPLDLIMNSGPGMNEIITIGENKYQFKKVE
jgi:hypothetical protein